MSDAQTSPGADGSMATQNLDPRLAAIGEVFGDEFRTKFREPVIFETYTFSSPPPKNMYRRDFQLLSRALFLESVYRRRVDFDPAILDNFSEIVGSKMVEISTLFERRQQQLRAMLKQQGYEPQKVYLQDETMLVPVIASQARGFMRLLQMLEESYQLIGCANLYGVMTGAQRRTAELESRKAIRSYIGRVREGASKVRKEMMRLRTQAQIETTAEEAHAEVLVDSADAQYDRDDHDRTSAVEPGQAAEIMDSMIAQSNAVAQATGSRRGTKKADAPVEQGAAEGQPA